MQQVLAVRTGNTIRRCSDACKQRRFHDAQELCLPSGQDGDREFQAMLEISFADAPVQYRDFEQAVFWLVKAAGQGPRDAQFRFAGFYSRGRGISRDYEEALFWYEEAAINGQLRSRVRPGEMYRDGLGTPVDLVLAYQWYNLGSIASEAALEQRDEVGRRLIPTQLLDAQLRSIEWLQQNIGK